MFCSHEIPEPLVVNLFDPATIIVRGLFENARRCFEGLLKPLAQIRRFPKLVPNLIQLPLHGFQFRSRCWTVSFPQ
jgi:hypothetical protein